MKYDEELVIKLYKDYITWINNNDLEDSMDNYIYYIENIQTIHYFEKIQY